MRRREAAKIPPRGIFTNSGRRIASIMKERNMSRPGSVLALVAVWALPLAAAPHRYIVHPNPSIGILCIAEGPDGFLWLAAEDGLYFFDGFHYQKVPDFPFASARFVAFTGDGSLWAGGAQGLARRAKDRFDVISREIVTSLYAFPDRVFVKAARHHVRILLSGDVAELPFDAPDYPTVDSSGLLWFGSTRDPRAIAVDPARPDAILERVALPDAFEQVVRDSRGRLWAADLDRAALIQDGKQTGVLTRRHSQRLPRPYPLFPGRNGQLWFLGEKVQGLVRPETFHDRALNDQYLPTAGYEDRRGHLWVAKLGQGLVEWIPEPSWERWPSENFAGLPAAQVVRTARNEIVVAAHANLYRLDSGQWRPIARESREYAAILPLPEGGFLASIRRFGVARLLASGEVAERPPNPLRSLDEYRRLFRDGQGRLWVGDRTALLEIVGQPGSLRLREEKLPELGANENTQAIEFQLDSSRRLWVGYARGIAWKDEQDRWHRVPLDPLGTGIRSFALADESGEDIWAGFRSADRFARLQKKNGQWSITEFTPYAGYGPEDSHFIQRDSRGWIWRGAPDGVHVSDGVHVGPNDWLHISAQNGLATESTDQYGFFADTDGTVWIAGEDGVSHLNPEAWWFQAPAAPSAPRITRVEADGREQGSLWRTPQILPQVKDSLRIEVGTLEAPPFRDYPFRYRLRPLFDNWRLSHDGTLDFQGLAPDSYTLEVALNGAGDSPVLTYPFRIGPPAVRISWLWLSLPLGGGALALFSPWFPWSERVRYWATKRLFLLRRRLAPMRFSSSGDHSVPGSDYTGAVLAERYQVIRAVSRGGFSVVYDARDLRDGYSRVAIKVLNAASGSESWVRDRFAHEVAALQAIRHRAVIRVLDSWISPDGEPCLAMPFLEGPTLREALRNGPLAPHRVAFLIRELGSALAEVHAHGVVHRDLKPENVMLPAFETGEQPVIIDFGTAGLRGPENELAATTLLAGSFHYMAPERLTGHYSPASDVYSLGVILLEMLTRSRLADLRVLFSDQAFFAELARVVRPALGPDQTAALVEELSKAYDPQPQGRPSDLRAWSQTVAAILDRA
jgi:ligand-binding sensor domain-containing protein